MEDADRLTEAAEKEWLETWVAGPGEKRSKLLDPGTSAPEHELLDHTGTSRRLSSFWSDGPALLMFWRHFGCGCGVDRSSRLNEEYADYLAAGINTVIIGQGEPERAASYREKYDIPCSILCDPEFSVYSAYGLANFGVEQVLYDAPEETWCHSIEIGVDFQEARRAMSRPLVDNPWLSTGEFLVLPSGMIRTSYAYQYCSDYPDPRVFLTAAKMNS
ncbi:MAG: redoxin domain-containing protein [Candidatus Thalassarchaeaceae archaeon]|jgi:peroxiredoxin|nr:redoxin domain-containing protein [Candidatus Thalassarchaeaceae archaeon]